MLSTNPSALQVFLAILLLILTYRYLSNTDHSLRARLRKGLHGIAEQLNVVDLELNHQTTLSRSLQNQLRAKDTQLAEQAARLASQAHQLALKDITHKMSYMKLNRRNALLAARLKATSKEMNERSFAAFCERLLLNNKVWKRERELKAFAERIGCLSVGTGVESVDLDAEADAKKEALVEGLIQEIVDDLEESQKQVSTLMLRHDAEVKAINDGWFRDYGTLLREVEQAKAGRRVSIAEGVGYESMDETESLDASDDDMGSPTSTVLNDLEPESDPDNTLIHINPHLKYKLSSMESEDLDLRSLPLTSLPCDEPPPPLDIFSLSCPTSSPVCFSPTFHFCPMVIAQSPHSNSHPHPQNANPDVIPTPTHAEHPVSRKRPHRDSQPKRDPSSNAALEALKLKGKLPMWPTHAGQLRASADVSKMGIGSGRSAKRAKVGH